jgi:thiamine-phosphate pyrophosphorylase
MTYEENLKARNSFRYLGASCHSVEDAVKAERLGCTYITAGHIFATDCKKGVPPRGLEFLKEVCESIDIPVYAIGGINSENMNLTIEAGAKGVCIMSGFMRGL